MATVVFKQYYNAQIPGYGFMLSVPLVKNFVNLVGIPMLPSIYPALLADSSNQMDFVQRLV